MVAKSMSDLEKGIQNPLADGSGAIISRVA